MTNKHLNLKNHTTLSRLTLLAVSLGLSAIFSGCATTHGLTAEQCQTANWKDIGYADGSAGRAGDYFGKHLNACHETTINAPNRQLWEQGRQEGLKSFCTELNAYVLGREGYAWRPVCPLEGIEKLEDAYRQGRYYYLRQKDLDNFTAPMYYPYPWYYHRFDWRSPYWQK